MSDLAKFDEAQHPRGEHGRFASAGIGHNDGPPMLERRTQARMPSYYRIGSKTAGMPPEYTGSDRKEMPVGSFLKAEFHFHKPKSLTGPEREQLRQGLIGVINSIREPSIARGHEIVRSGKRRGLPMIPEGTPKRTINRAYNHAAMIGLHKYGVGHYDFQMDDDLKAELEPLRQFMFYAQRRVTNRMHEVHTGEWKPHRAEFGIPFKDGRTDEDGNVRLRVKPLHEFIKAVPIGELAKVGPIIDHVWEEAEHPRGIGGRFAAAARTAGRRMMRAAPFIGLGLALGAYVKGSSEAVRYVQGGSEYKDAKKQGLTRDTSGLSVRNLGRHRDEWRDHVQDMLHRPTRRGRTPNEDQIKRQFLRDSFRRRERLLLLDPKGKVLVNSKGDHGGVDPGLLDTLRMYRHLKAGNVARTLHNHPTDTVPSTPDAVTVSQFDETSPNPISHEVYSFGRTADGKTRIRHTVYDGVPYLNRKDDLSYFTRNLREEDWESAKAKGSAYRTSFVEKLAR